MVQQEYLGGFLPEEFEGFLGAAGCAGCKAHFRHDLQQQLAKTGFILHHENPRPDGPAGSRHADVSRGLAGHGTECTGGLEFSRL